MRTRIEWAVLEPVFRGTVALKEGLGSREEAELWMDALTVTLKRQDLERFYVTDGHVNRQALFIGWRVIDGWHGPDEDPPE